VIFQTLDDKTECVGLYANQRLHFSPGDFPPNLTATWNYVPYLDAQDIEYASLYLEGKPVEDVIPEYLRDDWEDVNGRIRSFKRSLRLAQVDMNQNCFFDLVPNRFLCDWCEVKNSITEHVLATVPRPERYTFYKEVSKMISEIAHREVKIDRRLVSSFGTSPKFSNQAARILASAPRVCYNQFGTKTGRLTTRPATFPVLTLPKVFRQAIAPQNDYFLELDFNGAEVRTLLGVLEKDQPSDDIHTFHLTQIFKDLSTRSQAKEVFFAWLYGAKNVASSHQLSQLDAYYQKASVLSQCYHDGVVTTPFKKKICDVTPHHALNYIIQSTTAELCLKQFLKLNCLLSRTAFSRVAFLIHDAIVIDMKKEDDHLLDDLLYLMSSTTFGNFQVNVKKGTNLGEMIPWTK